MEQIHISHKYQQQIPFSVKHDLPFVLLPQTGVALHRYEQCSTRHHKNQLWLHEPGRTRHVPHWYSLCELAHSLAQILHKIMIQIMRTIFLNSFKMSGCVHLLLTFVFTMGELSCSHMLICNTTKKSKVKTCVLQQR